MPPLLLLLLPLLFSFSQDTAGDQILLLSVVSVSGDQIPECGEAPEDRRTEVGLSSLFILRLGTDLSTTDRSGRRPASLGLSGLWRLSRLIGNFLKSKISEDGESGVSGETESLVLRLRGVV